VNEIAWRDDVADKDHEPAFQYLSPRIDARRAGQIVRSLKAAEVTARRQRHPPRLRSAANGARAPRPACAPDFMNASPMTTVTRRTGA
jgi:hypothetical protein